jgi:membrane protein DedA with SNARE-associated domain
MRWAWAALEAWFGQSGSLVVLANRFFVGRRQVGGG